jgi:hypothetical protein
MSRESPRMTRGGVVRYTFTAEDLSPHTSCRSPGAPVHHSQRRSERVKSIHFGPDGIGNTPGSLWCGEWFAGVESLLHRAIVRNEKAATADRDSLPPVEDARGLLQ